MSGPERTKRTLSLTPMSGVLPQRQLFLWNERIPMGTGTIFAGRGGEGKSTFSLWLAAQVTLGLLDGEFSGIPSNVLLVGHEDDLSTVVRPRLIAAGADAARIFAISVKTSIEGLDILEVPSIAEDLGRIREAIETTGAKLIIVDPLTSMMDGANLDKTADVRRALNPFTALAAEMNVAIVALMHFRKGQGDTRDLLSGSHSFRDTFRSVILFVTDDDTGQRIATIDKANYSESRGDSFAFNLVSTPVPVGNGESAFVARVEYLGASAISVSDIVNKPDSTDLGEDIRRVVEYVNAHTEETKPATAAVDLNMDAAAVRTYFSRAASRGLITKSAYGTYLPRATAITASAPVSAVAPVALYPLSATSETRATRNTEKQTVAPSPSVRGKALTATPNETHLCPTCNTDSHATNEPFGYLHPGCEATS
jgi:hypothetical protein